MVFSTLLTNSVKTIQVFKKLLLLFEVICLYYCSNSHLESGEGAYLQVEKERKEVRKEDRSKEPILRSPGSVSLWSWELRVRKSSEP